MLTCKNLLIRKERKRDRELRKEATRSRMGKQKQSKEKRPMRKKEGKKIIKEQLNDQTKTEKNSKSKHLDNAVSLLSEQKII